MPVTAGPALAIVIPVVISACDANADGKIDALDIANVSLAMSSTRAIGHDSLSSLETGAALNDLDKLQEWL